MTAWCCGAGGGAGFAVDPDGTAAGGGGVRGRLTPVADAQVVTLAQELAAMLVAVEHFI